MPEPVSLSQTQLFPSLRDFYTGTGVAAWAGIVPLHATSNPSLANSYAQVIVRFVQDAVATGRVDPTEPFYVLELGAGSGKFGFHLVKRLRELRLTLGVGPRIVHVMSDVVDSNIEYWRRHPNLTPFMERGELLLARLDAEGTGAFHLVTTVGEEKDNPSRELTTFANPLTVVANYVFDSLPQDLFRVVDGQLDEMLATPVAAENGDTTRFSWSPRPVVLPHYGDPELDALLAEVKPQTGSDAVMFPVVALRTLRRLADAAQGRLCLLAVDLGMGPGLRSDPELQLRPDTGFFYLPVELPVIGQFFARLGPGIHRHLPATTLDASLSVAGFEPDELRETRFAFTSSLEAFGPRGRAAAASLLERGGAVLEAEEWMAMSSLLRYDSTFFTASVDVILGWIREDKLRPPVKRELLAVLRFFGAEVYWTPGAPDTYFDLGVVLQELADLKAAIASYVRSIETVGPSVETYVNLALALRALDRRADALEALRDGLAVDPTHIVARGWLGRIQLEMAGELPISS
jgi:tetratricopeptide (TPR) repeat protein